MVKDELIKDGLEKYKVANYEGAIELFKKALKRAPKDKEANYNLAVTYSKIEDKDLALKHYKRASEADSSDFKILALIGELYTQKKKFKEALTYLNKSLAINPNYVAIHYYIGNYRLKTGDYDLAILSYKKAKTLGSKSAKLYYGMGMAYKYKGEFGLCANCMSLVLEKDPQNIKARKVLLATQNAKAQLNQFNKSNKII